MWERCAGGGNREGESWQEAMKKILGEEGEGEEWMRSLEVARGGERERERMREDE